MTNANSSPVDLSGEIALGLVGLLVSTGFMKANELFQYFDFVDAFKISGTSLVVRGPEFVAAIGFTGTYVIFLVVAGSAIAHITRSSGGKRTASSLHAASAVIATLIFVQFMALSTGYSHAMHRYNEAFGAAQTVQWVFGSK